MQHRYSRQQLFTPIGADGQQKIQAGHVLIVGVGALGSANAEALARAGIGKLTLIDRDFVEWSNLQRQQLYTEADAELKLPKVIAAKARLAAINSSVNIDAQILDAESSDFEKLLDGIDLIIDATDNFDVRFLLNDLAQKYTIPWIYGSCVGSFGTVFTIVPNVTPCLRCLVQVLPTHTMTCDTVGIISPAVQIVAAYQTAEALKFLVSGQSHLQRKFVTFDVWQNQHYEIRVDEVQRHDCPSCGANASYPALAYEQQTKLNVLCGRDAVQIRPAQQSPVPLDTLAKRLAVHGKIQQNPYLIACQTPDYRVVVFHDGRVVIHGVQTIDKAKTIYYRLFG